MYSYLISAGHLFLGDKYRNSLWNTTCPPCTTAEFKLAVFTVPANALACALSCDSCQPTKFKGHPRAFIYVRDGYLFYDFHALKPFRTTSRSSRIDRYTTGEGPLLKKHRNPSGASAIPVLFQLNTSKWLI